MSTTRNNYTAPEWNTLQAAIVGVGFYVRKLAPNALDSWRARRAAENIIDDIEDDHDDTFFRQLCDTDDFKSYLPKHVPRDADAIESYVLQAIEAAIHILEEKDPTKLAAYKSLLLEIAHETADEVDDISPQERQALGKIIRVLNGELEFADSWRMTQPFD